MFFPRWNSFLNHLRRTARNRDPGSRRPGPRPRLEALEDRWLPAVAAGFTTVVSLTVNANVNITTPHDSDGEEAIAVNPTNPNNLIAAPIDDQLLFGTPSREGIWYSFNGGATWTLSVIPMPPGGTLADGDPSIVFSNTGRAVYSQIAQAGTSSNATRFVATAVSLDGGQTWTAGEVDSPYDGIDHDKDSLAVGPDASNPSVDRFYSTWQTNGGIFVSSSADGLNWTPAVQASSTATGSRIDSYMAVSPAGVVYLVWEDYSTPDKGSVVFTSSSNDGQTWAAEKVLRVTNINTLDDTTTPSGVYTIPAQPDRGISVLPGIDVDRSGGAHNGRIYVTFTDAPTSHNDTNIYLMHSDDGGNTWSTPVEVNDDQTTNSQFFPSVAVDQTTGYVGLTWYDARNAGPANNVTQLYGTVSTDGGNTFLPNIPIAAGLSYGAGMGTFNYGDYAGLAYYDNVMHPMWADNSDSTGNDPAGHFSLSDAFTAAVVVQTTTLETVVATGDDNGPANDEFIVSLDPTGQDLQVWQNNPTMTGNPTFSTPYAGVYNILVYGYAGNDTLIVDYQYGNPMAHGIYFDGGTGTNAVVAGVNTDFQLADNALVVLGYGSIGLNNVQVADLGVGAGNHVFNVSGWTGQGTLIGSGGSDIVQAAKDANFVLYDTLLTATDGLSMNLQGVTSAQLFGGPGNNFFDVAYYSGTAYLNGEGGYNAYRIYLKGSGNGTVEIAGTADDQVHVYAPAGNNTIVSSANQTTLGNENVYYSGVSTVALHGLGGNDYFAIVVTPVPVQFLVYGGPPSGVAPGNQLLVDDPTAMANMVVVPQGSGGGFVEAIFPNGFISYVFYAGINLVSTYPAG